MATISNVSQFSPTQVSGCSLWLDAADPNGNGSIPASGSALTTWVDKSGNGKNATASSSSTYILDNQNRNTIYLNNQGFSITSFVLSPTSRISVFCVLNHLTTSTTANMDFIGTPNSYSNFTMSIFNTTNNYLIYVNSGGAIASTGYTTINRITLYELVYDGNSGTPFVNGSNFTSFTRSPGSALTISQPIGFCGGPATNTYYYEAIMFNTNLTSTQRQQVEGYLAWKWNLQASLPTTHPFYTNPFVRSVPITPIVLPFAERTNYSLLPSQISGCALWLDAADANSVVLSGSNVSQWNDKSGNGSNATQVTAGNRPTYINNGVSFTASSSNSMSINVPYSISHSIFLVGRSTSGTQNYYYGRVGGGAAPTIIQHYVGTSIEYFDGTDRATFVTSPPTNSPFIVNFVRSYGNTVTGFYMGSNAFSIPQTWTFDQINPWAYIGRSDNNANYLNATICEFIIFRAALTTTQRQQIEGYLAWKWNLQSSLPSTHPFFRNPFIANLSITTSIANVYRITNKSFSPPPFPGMALWLDAADPFNNGTRPSSGSSISTWNDKSGNARNAVSVTSPTYNSVTNGIRFRSATTTTMNLPDGTIPSGNSSYSVFILMTLSSTPTAPNGVLYSGTSTFLNNQILGFYAGSTMNVTWHNNDLGMPTFPYNVNTRYIFTSTYASGSIRVNYTNGTQYASDTPGTRSSAATFNKIGAFYSNNSYPFDGEIYEIFVFSNVLTTTQRQQVEGYLAWKWGLQKSLPTNHPFYLFPPG